MRGSRCCAAVSSGEGAPSLHSVGSASTDRSKCCSRRCTGVSISTGRASEVRVDPDLPEAAQLRTWYDTVGRGAATAPAGEGLANGRCTPHERH